MSLTLTINSLFASGDFCRLLITFANNFNPDQERQYVGPNLDSKIVSEYDQELPQSQTLEKPMAREEEPPINHQTPGRQTKQSYQLSLPHQDDCKTRIDIK